MQPSLISILSLLKWEVQRNWITLNDYFVTLGEHTFAPLWLFWLFLDKNSFTKEGVGMNCPKCDSSNTTEFDKTLKHHHYLCKDCDTQWHKTNTVGHVLSVGGALLTVVGILVGADRMGGGNSQFANVAAVHHFSDS